MTTAPDRNVPRRGVLWFGTVAMLLFTALMVVFFNQAGWHTPQLAFVGVCGAMTFGLALILINGSRFFWWLRVATFAVFAVLFWYVIDQGFIHRHPLSLDNPGAPSFFNALRGFLFSDCRACSTRCGEALGASWVLSILAKSPELTF